MNEEEKTRFEEELKTNPVLLQEVEQIRNNLGEFRELTSAEVDETYFSGIIPEFRKRRDAKKKTKSFSLAYQILIPAAAVVTVLFILLFNREEESALELTDIKMSEIEGIFSEYSLYDNINSLPEADNSLISEKIDSLYASELSPSEAGMVYFETEGYNSLIASISDEDAEMIYNQLINKEIIPGEL